MPEEPISKFKQHPRFEHAVRNDALDQAAIRPAVYAELQVTSNFTFLTGASHPDEMVHQAGLLGYRAIAVTDTNTLAGIVRAHVAGFSLSRLVSPEHDDNFITQLFGHHLCDLVHAAIF